MKIALMCLRLVVAVTVIGLFATQARADSVSGSLTRTYVIVENTDLTGDVRCDVANATPCFSFGASGVELRLNGFTITGRADAITGCNGTSVPGEAGVSTSGMSGVLVRGPGLVQRFRGDGVTVAASTNARIEGLTLSTNCMSGVRVLGTSFGTLVQSNVSVRNGSSAPGQACGGI